VRSLAAAVVASSLAAGACLPADWGANAILHPSRRPVAARPDLAFEELSFANGEVTLKGWIFRATAPRRGWIVYLHGIADNRQSAIGFARRFVPQGYDVLAYDGRAHGESTGTAVTYGVLEKRDLLSALDAAHVDRAVLFGCSLGASVALQAAPLDPRIAGVVAQSPFADLRSIVFERKPWIATRGEAERALALAGKRGGFDVDEASVLRAAPRIAVPVLLIHGANDRATSPAHSQRIFEALAGPKQLLLVPGAGHDDTLAASETWQSIETWLERIGRVPRHDRATP
jgi:pimeloyl-ACP methyl ester carboxylesterase